MVVVMTKRWLIHNQPSIKIDGQSLSQFGQGSGALGLPGDFTPPSRFIRAGFLRDVVLPGKDGTDEVKITYRILDQFDIPKGSVKEVQDGKDIYEVTQWTSASDLNGGRYYFHTYDNRALSVVDLNKLKVPVEVGRRLLECYGDLGKE